MRLDKFLKIALIFKTRSSAEKSIDSGNVFINEKKAKPASKVKIGDKITIKFSLKTTFYEIIDIKTKSVTRQEAKELYKIIGEEKFEL